MCIRSLPTGYQLKFGNIIYYDHECSQTFIDPRDIIINKHSVFPCLALYDFDNVDVLCSVTLYYLSYLVQKIIMVLIW